MTRSLQNGLTLENQSGWSVRNLLEQTIIKNLYLLCCDVLSKHFIVDKQILEGPSPYWPHRYAFICVNKLLEICSVGFYVNGVIEAKAWGEV